MAFVQPGPDEVRITVLGKNRGESIVVHVGDGRWMIVDSLRGTWDDAPGVPAALGYLRAMGVDPAEAVDAVVLTHLHADHSEGIEAIVEACHRAELFLPSAIPDDGWRGLLRTIADEAAADEKPRMREIGTAVRMAQDLGTFRTVGATAVVGTGQTVHAIAPVAASQAIARGIAGDEAQRHVAKLMRQNATSIVLRVQAGKGAALLCADMDDHAQLGWPEVLREHEGKAWIGGAGYVKISHHGSKASQYVEMFERWTEDPIGVITPNRLGRLDLPRPADLPILHPLTQSLWLAGRPDPPASMTLTTTTYDADVWWVEASCDPETGVWTATARDGDAQLLYRSDP